MKQFDEQKFKEREEARRARSQPDEDGWVTIRGKGITEIPRTDYEQSFRKFLDSR